MNWKLIFNPFSKFSEIQLLIFGSIITLFGCFVGSYFHVSFDGVLDVHSNEVNFLDSLQENAINIVSVFIMLLVLGKIINLKTRVIDVLNTALISRLPLYILGVFVNNPTISKISEKLIENIDDPKKLPVTTSELSILLLFSVISLLFLAYKIVLLVFGFKTATNSKKWQHYVAFAVALIAAEILSKYLMNYA